MSIVTTAIIAMIVIPLIVISKISSSKLQKAKSELCKKAAIYGLCLTECDSWNGGTIGIDTNKRSIFYLKNDDSEAVILSLDKYLMCQYVQTNIGNQGNQIDCIKLRLTGFNVQDEIPFFEYKTQMVVTTEVNLAKKWDNLIYQQLKKRL